jgi:lysine-specific demethylase 8
MIHPLKPIRRIPCPSRAEFERTIMPRRRPVILSGGIDTWKARTWTFDSFPGTRDVSVHLEEGELFDCTELSPEGTILSKRRVEMPLRDFARELQSVTDDAPRRYLTEWPLFEFLPELAGDIDYARPNLFTREFAAPVRVYMGPAGCFTPMHYDHAHNMTAQILGSKRWVFYPPSRGKRMYPYDSEAQLAHFSRANSQTRLRDDAQFPLLRKLRGYEAIVTEGDLLYVPPGWWHHVYTLSPSLSLNFFWKSVGLLALQILMTRKRRALRQRRASNVPITREVIFAMARTVIWKSR